MTWIKHVHMLLAALTAITFLIRSYWMLTSNPRLQRKINRIFPHIIDTLLLITAGLLMWQTHQYPVTHDWLTIKVILVIVYIAAGFVALRQNFSAATKRIALVVSVLCLATIFYVALYKPYF